jgi:hypothetical protein
MKILENLPTFQMEPHSIHILKKNKHLALVLLQSSTAERVLVLTLHQVEAKKLAERLLEVVSSGDGGYSMVEGVFLGGPPEKSQIL